MIKRFFTVLLCLPLFISAQNEKQYQGLLWKISGNGLSKPSYLYGTMHVSNRVAFHLSNSFFNALDSSDIIALETNPEFWISDISKSELFQEIYATNFSNGAAQYPLYNAFIPNQPVQNHLAYYLARDQDMLNGMLWRFNQGDQDFEENTFLDLFIYQAGKKKGKKIIALEDFEESFKSVMKAGKYDKDAKRISQRQAEDILGDFSNWMELQEDAYRKGDLDMLDTITGSLNPGKYHRLNMLDIRNVIMADGMDSIMQNNSLFTGVGAAHLPGKMGVINLLREKGYTVEAIKSPVTPQSIEEKENIDDLYFKHELQSFISDDNFISTTTPGNLTKVVASPHQEYLFADMANGAFYSIKRIPTFAPLYGKNIEVYQEKIDSLLFENIPGKIINKNKIEISGYPALEIENQTKKKDWQRYNIIFTPLEIIIVKAGGNKEFVKRDQPIKFFEDLKINKTSGQSDLYKPFTGAFEVKLPLSNRVDNREGMYYNPFNTMWAQAVDDENDYFAVAHRQYHDFTYIEEDRFELEFFIEEIEDEDKLEIDTMYSIKRDNPAIAFELKNNKDEILYGQVHLKGPHYVMMISTATDKEKLNGFFESFAFTPVEYEQGFETYKDTAFHITMNAPQKLNNYTTFISEIYNSRGYYNQEDPQYDEEIKDRLFLYKPTGDQLHLEFKKFDEYISYENSEELWEDYKTEHISESLVLLEEKLISSTANDSNYFKEIKEFKFSDTNSTREIWMKVIIENGAAYRLTANVAANEPSLLVQEAFKSFDSSGDTVIGLSILHSRANMFFKDLESKDSLRVYEAKNSIFTTTFTKNDSERIKDFVENYNHEDFNREDRLKLLNRLAFIDDESNIDYLEKLYSKNLDSSAWQFAILEALADFETTKGNKVFLKLILDETPFTSDLYAYSNLIYELDDSLEIIDVVFPKLLELTDFEDYKPHIYGLLRIAVDSGVVKNSDYKTKYNTILRYAKVEIKKQRADDESKNKNSYNNTLNRYISLLRPFAKKKDVQEVFADIFKIRNKGILLDQVKLLEELVDIPDSLYNYIGSDEKARFELYEYLQERNKENLLKAEYRSPEALGLSIAQNINYKKFDTISFIESRSIELYGEKGTAYFYRAKNESDKLWKIVYVLLKNTDDGNFSTDDYEAEVGETVNLGYDDMDEILNDALKDIRTIGRKRVLSDDEYY